jgi:hypothetical protein
MTESEPPKTPARRKTAASNAAPKPSAKPASKPRAAAKDVTPPAAQPDVPTPPGAQPDKAPIPPRNRHERRSAGKKRPGQPPFKWPPSGPERS